MLAPGPDGHSIGSAPGEGPCSLSFSVFIGELEGDRESLANPAAMAHFRLWGNGFAGEKTIRIPDIFHQGNVCFQDFQNWS